MRSVVLFLALASTVSQPAFATKTVANRAASGGDCVMKENVTVGINFNMNAATMMEAKAKFDKAMNQIADYAADQKIENLEPQSMNYNIYNQNNGGENNYQVTGNVQYKMQSSDIAFKFAAFLEKQNMKININSNSYRQGNCNN